MAILRTESVTKTFPIKGTEPLVALEDISFEIDQGEFVCVVGPSGCGKSTLLNIIAGLLPHDSGRVLLYDEEVTGPHESLGVVFQEESVFPWRTAIDNVAFGMQMQGMPKRERREKAKATMELVGLSHFEDRYPAELSGGMRQRVAIARALVMQPAVLLMDEPFGALDEQTRVLLGEELLRIQMEIGQTIMFITHSISEAVQLADRVLTMSARPGRIRDITPIDLPRPRDSTIIASEEFGKYVGQVWATIRDESLKAFRQDMGPKTVTAGSDDVA